jgi:hypothetical protein
MFVVVVIILWALSSCLYGIGEGYYFYHLNQAQDRRGKKYDHLFLSVVRGVLSLSLLCVVWLSSNSWVITTLILIYFMSIFPFLHDGFYYITRNKFVEGTYADGWQHYQDGRAYLDFTYPQRVMLFIGGCASAALALLLLFR